MLKLEQAKLKEALGAHLTMRVSAKGAMSVYGLGKFPVTLYKEQWLKLIKGIAQVEAFIEMHPELAVKPAKDDLNAFQAKVD